MSFVAVAVTFLLAIPPRTALAICRVIEPGDRMSVAFDPTTSAFFVLAPDVVIGWECPAGMMAPDGGPGDLDAGVVDTGTPDAGVRDPDGTPICADGSRATPVRASVVSLVVQPRLLSGGGEAALVMPVPAHPQVVPATPEIFARVRASSGNEVHEVVEVLEDASLGIQCTDPHYTSSLEPGSLEAGSRETATSALALAEAAAALPMGVFGCSLESSYYSTDAGSRETGIYRPDGGTGSVIVESIPTSDEYEVTLLSATDVAALSSWLDDNGFAHDATDDAAFEAYVGDDHWFVALRVHPAASSGPLELAPLVVSWLGTEVPITHRLQYDPDGGVLVTDTWVLAPSRMDVEDLSAITESADHLIPVPETLSGFGLGFGTLTHLRISRRQRADVPDSRLVPVENVELRGTLEQTTRVHIPRPCCPEGIVAPSSGPLRVHRHERTFPVNSTPPIPEEWLRTSYEASATYCAAEASYAGGGWSSGSSGCGTSTATSSSTGRPLRGCAVPARGRASVALSWAPLGLALLWLWRRSRRK